MAHSDETHAAHATDGSAGRPQRLRLIVVLRLIAFGDFAAIVAVFLPTSVMSWGHEWLGLGPLPTEAIVGYLARSTAIFYALHGSLLFFVSTDVVRYQPVIRFLGIAIFCCGIAFGITDQFEPLPIWWRIGEGPLVMSLGAAIWASNRSFAQTPTID